MQRVLVLLLLILPPRGAKRCEWVGGRWRSSLAEVPEVVSPLVLVVNPKIGVKTVPELIEYERAARKRLLTKQRRTLEDTPSVRGMIAAVQHLVRVVEEK